MTSKCSYFDKGYCKNKSQCTQKHPPLECDGQCEDKIKCPKRHRVKCRNGKSCIYFKSNCCEFLHIETDQHDKSPNSIEQLKSLKEYIDTKLISIEAKLVELDPTTLLSNIKALESKYATIVNSLENKVKVLENQIKEGITSKSNELNKQVLFVGDKRDEAPSLQQE